jgi:two-component system sensor histidine kinase GlrK
MSLFARLLRPLSLGMVILFGFTLAVLPLVATLVSAVRAVDQLAQSSQTTAIRVAQLSQKNEMLRERLVDFERKAKRNLVLDDADSRTALDDAYRNFVEILEGLGGLVGHSGLDAQIAGVAMDAEAVFHRLAAKPGRSDAGGGENAATRVSKERSTKADRLRMDKADEWFSDLGGKTRELARAVSNSSEMEVRELETRSEDVQQRLLLRVSVWLPVSLALVSLLSFLTIRSIRQLDLAIRRLGAGDLVRPIRVAGPKDLEYLGERLDWLRSRLHGLEEAKQQFIRHVSHELKTPLANIHEGTELLADQVVGELNTEQRDIAQILASNTQKLDTLIAELINYSQVNARPSALRREKVDVDRLVQSIIEDCQLQFRAKSISVKPLLRSVAVFGNAEQLRTIIDNLLSNAIKYSPNDGEIRIGLRQTGGHMELEIEDDGPGIPPEEREHIFEPFFQGRAAKEGGVGGTGLGLAIVSECVAGHHGKVEALAPRPDKTGARIRVQIPCKLDN